MQYELDHNERAAVKALPMSEKTQKLAAELSALVAEREAVNPAIARIMEKLDTLTTDAATEKLVPLHTRQSVIDSKLKAKRKACFDAIVADAGKRQDQAEAEVERARLAHDATKEQFAAKVKAAFNTKDSQKLMRGQSAAQSSEVQDAFAAYRKANEVAGVAGVARKCLDRDYYVAKVAAGLAVSTGRPHVMPVEWYWQNAAIICGALMD